tara:strand:- start:254 stop:1090 length:837 start_codon:yes stop_codon:yes gene_type:complete
MLWLSLIIPATFISDITPQREIYTVDYSQDRCANIGCMAEVRFTSRPGLQPVVGPQYRKSVFYEENEYEITPEITNQVRSFLRAFSRENNFTVIGYTDGCGNHQQNRVLSQRRASRVANQIRSINPDANIETRWVGENTSSHSDNSRRVDIVLSGRVSYVAPGPEIIADFYLIDASGSMSDRWGRWLDAISYHRPRGSKVFVSTTQYVRHRADIRTIRPAGGTEIWFSYWSILDKMQPGQTLAIISDFDSTRPLLAWERDAIAQKVRERGVRVITYRP